MINQSVLVKSSEVVMSAGSFVSSRYELDGGQVAPIRVQPETLAATFDATSNAAPTTSITIPVSAKVSGSRREIGINARKVRIEWTGAAPEDYDANGIVTIPILQKDLYDAITKGQNVTYLGANGRVVGKTPEFLN